VLDKSNVRRYLLGTLPDIVSYTVVHLSVHMNRSYNYVISLGIWPIFYINFYYIWVA